MESLEKRLEDILSPLSRRLASAHLDFTPTEIQIAGLILEGKTSKEIAETMHLAPETISNHRKHMRKKIGATNKKVNLRTALASLSRF